ncbi:MAG: NnrS family protein [Verrucomicrobiaceae bacterium]
MSDYFSLNSCLSFPNESTAKPSFSRHHAPHLTNHFQPLLKQWCDEPFRLFFPLGFCASIIGVLLWPAYYHDLITFYPFEAHARLMVLGFAGSLITGFLGTAGPRLIGSAPWSLFELIWHSSIATTVILLLCFNHITPADLCTGFWFLGILGSILFRLLLDRHDVPPPGLPLAALGLLLTALAAFTLSLHPIIRLSHPVYSFWRLTYFQGLLWLPILGVAPYLLPRFFNQSSPHSFNESLTIPTGWKPLFVRTLAIGLLFLATFAIEGWVHPAAGLALRGLIVAASLWTSVPGLFSLQKISALATATRWVPLCALGGWLLASLYPAQRIGMMHLMFIGSAGLLMLCAATRVILGHNERHDRLATPMRWFHLLTGLVLLTAATRLTSDFILTVRITHFTYASILWVVIVLFWRWKLQRELLAPRDQDPAPKRKCPRRPTSNP